MTTSTHNGSISCGTLRNEDLIPCFASYLRAHSSELSSGDLKTLSAIEDAMRDWGRIYFDAIDQANDDLEWLFNVLNALAPAGYAFGSHWGDAADFGFWPIDEDEENTRD